MDNQEHADQLPVIEEVNAAEGYSFGALLEQFFMTSPLGKDLAKAQVGYLEGKAQELFVGSDAYSYSRKAGL
ncbi:MAG: hypothetical protein JST06_00025 [Bacteroidetes bacterium]|nr:hypothetical protein [Bacteroidota bacterium]MBS1629457.1 hypothetical protein [Bacteroidota bacterium]